MTDFKLSASLEEHEDDVRAVSFPSPDFVVSASRDTTVRTWKRISEGPPTFDATISSHGTAFINAIAYLRPSPEYPEGLIFSGGKDTVIEARRPGKPPEDNAEALLLGHAHNVCALDVSLEGNYVVSGSWDNTARVWKIGKWECEAMLEGHGGSVWATFVYDSKTIITGCADSRIRIFNPEGKLLKTIECGKDVVRALCRLPSDHPSGAEFASAGNDGTIRLWKLNGQQVGELRGHESYIYSLICLPSGELASSGEDRTVRIWRGDRCIQTITHPAISVWGVASCVENGDIVTGASDRKVRVFTRSPERQASSEGLKAFEDSVRSSSIPQQQMDGDGAEKEKIPGPDFLQQKSGTKDGQVQQIRETNGSITAHQWSQSTGSWSLVGTVVDAPGSSGRKTSYRGKDYDHVFDVDIEEGKPTLKLPYNIAQNPYEAATQFLQDNELPMTYLDEVAAFITSNTQGATLGQAAPEPVSRGPWESGAYRPGQQESSSKPQQPAASRPKVLPQTAYLSIKTANMRLILKKITELNDQLTVEGSNDISLGPDLLTTLESATKPLEQALASDKHTTSPAGLEESIPVIFHMLKTWPPAARLPALDLLRLFAAATPQLAEQKNPGVIDLLASTAFGDKDRSNNIMLAIRAFGNLFETPPGQHLVDDNFDKIHGLIKESLDASNRNLTIAIATLYVNYAVLFTSSDTFKSLPSTTDRSLELLGDLTEIIKKASDSEAVYRGLVAIGTLLTVDDMIQDAAREVYDVESAVSKAEGRIKEPRVKNVVVEVRKLLKEGGMET